MTGRSQYETIHMLAVEEDVRWRNLIETSYGADTT
jgi:hypothetical protein